MHHLTWKGQMTMLMMMTLLGRCSDITCTIKIPSWQKVLSILFAFFFFLGPDMDVCLQEYGHCNFISEKHCSIFYDEVLLRYVVAGQSISVGIIWIQHFRSVYVQDLKVLGKDLLVPLMHHKIWVSWISDPDDRKEMHSLRCHTDIYAMHCRCIESLNQ